MKRSIIALAVVASFTSVSANAVVSDADYAETKQKVKTNTERLNATQTIANQSLKDSQFALTNSSKANKAAEANAQAIKDTQELVKDANQIAAVLLLLLKIRVMSQIGH